MIKRALLAVLAALIAPFLGSFVYSVYFTVRYSDRASVSPNEAYMLATKRFPGQQIFWLTSHIVGLCAWPFILWKRRHKKVTHRLYTTEVQLPIVLADQLTTFMRELISTGGSLNLDNFLKP